MSLIFREVVVVREFISVLTDEVRIQFLPAFIHVSFFHIHSSGPCRCFLSHRWLNVSNAANMTMAINRQAVAPVYWYRWKPKP